MTKPVVSQDGTAFLGNSGEPSDAAHIHAAANWVPADNGLVAAVAAPETMSGGGGATVAGTLYLSKIPLRYPVTVFSQIWFNISSAGLGASTGSFTGVYDPNGNLLGTSTDIGASLLLSTGTKSFQFGTSVAIPATAGFIWAALVTNLASTQPTLRSVGQGSPSVMNTNLGNAVLRCAINGTSLSALPATITPSSNASANSFPYWFGISQ